MLTLFNLTPEDGVEKKRFSFVQIRKGLDELDRQAKLASAVESALRTPFQRAVIQLRDGVVLYQGLQDSLVPAGADDFLAQVAQLNETMPGGLAAIAASAPASRMTPPRRRRCSR